MLREDRDIPARRPMAAEVRVVLARPAQPVAEEHNRRAFVAQAGNAGRQVTRACCVACRRRTVRRRVSADGARVVATPARRPCMTSGNRNGENDHPNPHVRSFAFFDKRAAGAWLLLGAFS